MAAVLVLTMALLGACSDEADSLPDAAAAASAPAVASQPAFAEVVAPPVDVSFPLSITDDNGNEVVIAAPPERIVAYDSAALEILFAIGEGSRVVGTHDFASFPAEVAEVPKVGNYFDVNLEKIVELEPDLVSIWFDASLDALDNAGVEALYLDEPDTVDGIHTRIVTWGRITGNVEAAEALAADFDARLAAVHESLDGVAEGPSVFHDTSEGLWTAGPDTLIGSVYSLLKARNVAHDVSGYAQLSPEVLLERNPDVIVTAFPDLQQAYFDEPAFQSLAAVVAKRVETIDPDLVSVAGPRYIEAIEELARVLYPDLFE